MTRRGTLADLEPGTTISTVAGRATVLHLGASFALIRFHDDDTQATLNPDQEPFTVLARPRKDQPR
jgi:hypothetical protein